MSKTLCVELKNCTRHKDVRVQRELEFRDSLLDKCSPEILERLIDSWRRNRKFSCDYPRFYRAAFREATHGISDKEKDMWKFELSIK